ncbi:MAG: potassium-transporting ATPase subunit KdpC [Thermoleophilia bacterium]|nr:potassium-transporting ATPase subunit KdpC [Thermoleophilia bacterium]
MRRFLRPLATAAGMIVVFTVLLGLAYPLAMTGVAQVLFPAKADGSLVSLEGEVVGSELAGQVFTSPAYFHSRPSATTPAYNPSATTFANLGPNTLALRDAVDGYIAQALALERPHNPGLRAEDLPVDMITTSASGIDPHVSVANARLQAARVAAVRDVPEGRVLELIDDNTEGRSLGFLGESGVNVLLLNLDLDRLAGPPARS